MRKTLCILALISALGCPALAGEMLTPPAPAGEVHTRAAPQREIHNPPPPTDAAPEPDAQGDIQYGQPGAAAWVALSLLWRVLGVL